MSAATAHEAPSALPVNPDGISRDLSTCPQWVGWGWEWVDDRWTKVPRNPSTGKRASSTDRATWAAFEVALAFAQREHLPGIGFVVTPDDPFVGIDLDKCRNSETGAIEPWASAIIDRFDSLTEITPTGTGVRIWITTQDGLLPGGMPGKRKGRVEIYAAGRFFTVTGHRFDGGGS